MILGELLFPRKSSENLPFYGDFRRSKIQSIPLHSFNIGSEIWTRSVKVRCHQEECLTPLSASVALNQLTGFSMRATLALNGLILGSTRNNFVLTNLLFRFN